MNFITGQQLLAVPEAKRYVLKSNYNDDVHLVTEQMLKNAFKDEYVRIMANRHPAWFVYEHFD